MMGAAPPPDIHRPDADRPAEPTPARRIDSASLMGNQRELIIEHGVDAYRLRLTSKGKLILTK